MNSKNIFQNKKLLLTQSFCHAHEQKSGRTPSLKSSPTFDLDLSLLPQYQLNNIVLTQHLFIL
jgi:hypothetical protein